MCIIGELNLICSKCGEQFTTTERFCSQYQADRWKESKLNSKSHICSQCFRTNTYNEIVANALEKAKENGYPALIGTNVQINHASVIRQLLIERILMVHDDNLKAIRERVLRLMLERYPEAEWWIKNNNNDELFAVFSEMLSLDSEYMSYIENQH